jgi:ribosomal protein L18
VGIREKHTSRREPINIRRPRLSVTAKATDPIVQIIDSNEQDVWTVSSCSAFGRKDEQSNQADD